MQTIQFFLLQQSVRRAPGIAIRQHQVIMRRFVIGLDLSRALKQSRRLFVLLILRAQLTLRN